MNTEKEFIDYFNGLDEVAKNTLNQMARYTGFESYEDAVKKVFEKNEINNSKDSVNGNLIDLEKARDLLRPPPEPTSKIIAAAASSSSSASKNLGSPKTEDVIRNRGILFDLILDSEDLKKYLIDKKITTYEEYQKIKDQTGKTELNKKLMDGRSENDPVVILWKKTGLGTKSVPIRKRLLEFLIDHIKGGNIIFTAEEREKLRSELVGDRRVKTTEKMVSLIKKTTEEEESEEKKEEKILIQKITPYGTDINKLYEEMDDEYKNENYTNIGKLKIILLYQMAKATYISFIKHLYYVVRGMPKNTLFQIITLKALKDTYNSMVLENDIPPTNVVREYGDILADIEKNKIKRLEIIRSWGKEEETLEEIEKRINDNASVVGFVKIIIQLAKRRDMLKEQFPDIEHHWWVMNVRYLLFPSPTYAPPTDAIISGPIEEEEGRKIIGVKDM